ncbi:hypothetical protein [Brevibacillus sp. SYSU BS000544]|uniref:hypothetical protein n=1 Tax=Brevibacillus sp. SYSU BS000544 TaxID=3416443 RepID=UPI003CE49A7B
MKSVKVLSSLALVGSLLSATPVFANQANSHAQYQHSDSVEVSAVQSEAKKAVTAINSIKKLLKKADQNKLDYKGIEKLYKTNLQSLVQERDTALKEKVDSLLMAALQDGKDGKVTAKYVAELFDKLLIKETFAFMRAELRKVSDDWQDKEKAKADYTRATEYFAGLKDWVKTTDGKFGVTLQDKINGGIADLAKAIDEGNTLNYNLARQVVDKTMMKAFYLHTNQYAVDIEKLAKAGDANVKAEQAAAWATYQVLHSYIVKEGETAEDANYINSMFDNATDPKTIDSNKINKAMVRGFIGVTKSEFAASFEEANWGKDKSKITALEGLLFINLMETDLQKKLGKTSYNALVKTGTQLVNAINANDKAKAEKLHKSLLTSLDIALAKVIE